MSAMAARAPCLLLAAALERKYGRAELAPLDDRAELAAHDEMAEKI